MHQQRPVRGRLLDHAHVPVVALDPQVRQVRLPSDESRQEGLRSGRIGGGCGEVVEEGEGGGGGEGDVEPALWDGGQRYWGGFEVEGLEGEGSAKG